MINGIRIDERLVHAQVANTWVKALGISRIVVIDDQAEDNSLTKRSLERATPSGVKLSVLTVIEAAENFKENKYTTQAVLIVVKNPQTLVSLSNSGVAITEVNVGIMAQKPDATELTPSVYVTVEDAKNLLELAQKGVHLVAQLLPTDQAVEVLPLLTK